MSLRSRFYAAVIAWLGTIVLVLASTVVIGLWAAILLGFMGLIAFGICVSGLRCPHCQKVINVVEAGGFSISMPFAQTICSRCGYDLRNSN